VRKEQEPSISQTSQIDQQQKSEQKKSDDALASGQSPQVQQGRNSEVSLDLVSARI